MRSDFDIVIVGGGPAGCACAMALSDSGYTIALIDKAVFPRDKICGDAIPGPTFKAIKSINPKWEAELRERCAQNPVTASKAFISAATISYNWKLYSSNSKRIDFDAFLFNIVRSQTNTTIFENEKLTGVAVNKEAVTLTLQNGDTLTCKMLAGCDGANSIIKKTLVPREKKDHIHAAVRAYFTNISGVTPDQNEFHLMKEVDGYFWIFPLTDNYYNVGFGILNQKKHKQTIDVRKIFNNIIQSAPFKERFANATQVSKINGYGIPAWTNSVNISGDRFVLVGDAASLVDPLQGHGIDKAVKSGIIAANQIKACFAADNFSADFMKAYDKEIQKSLGKELNRNLRLVKASFRFRFLFGLIPLLKPSQQLINYCIRKIKI